jgi:diaminopimelate epimerase
MKFKTHLISGAGNTFHITSELLAQQNHEGLSPADRKLITKKICTENTADGFIFLKKTSSSEEYAWDFYNNDGSDAEMCGNATRCVGYYLSEILKDKNSKWNLQTTAGQIEIKKISRECYQVIMTEPKILTSKHGFFCDTGVPHLVQELVNFKQYKEKETEAALLRNHTDFKPKGTNVTYVHLLSENSKVKAVSYERGVEDFTEACGTGAMAAALFNLMKRGTHETEVEMPGGTLMMNLANLKTPIMEGPAVLIGQYEYEYKK